MIKQGVGWRFLTQSAIVKIHTAKAFACTARGTMTSLLLEGTVALITGGASGIGLECARTFVKHGAQVVLADVQEAKGQEAAKDLGPGAVFVRCDVSKEDDVERAVAAAEQLGRLTTVINNAGVIGAGGAVYDVDMAAFSRTLDINLKGVMHGIKHGARAMRAAGTAGSIVNISSIAALSGAYGLAAYSAAKAGVVAITRVAAGDLAPDGIRVNAIAPGIVATPMVGIIQFGNASMPEEAMEKFAEAISPLKGSSLLAADIANAALYLASGLGRCVNGHTLVVDLGTTAGVTGQPVSQNPALAVAGFIGETGAMGLEKDQGFFSGMGSITNTPPAESTSPK